MGNFPKLDRRQAMALAAAGVAAGVMVKNPETAYADSPDEFQSKIVGEQNGIFFKNQPPNIYDYSAPRDMVRQLYDIIVPNMVNTWTAFAIPGVGIIDITPSKGYPIPFGSQLTSPFYPKDMGETSEALPQPEPTGLYTTGETAATWVLSINEDGYVIPEYHEEIVICYPFPVTLDANGRIIRDSKVSNAVVDTSRAGS